jgi:hypothetical protein
MKSTTQKLKNEYHRDCLERENADYRVRWWNKQFRGTFNEELYNKIKQLKK